MINILTPSGVKHFYRAASVNKEYRTLSVNNYRNHYVSGKFVVHEGTSEYEELCAALQRDLDSFTMMSISNYRRAFELSVDSISYWQHVTFYYAAFYAANAIMNAFGVSIGRYDLLHCTKSNPYNQEFSFEKTRNLINPRIKGSHCVTWEAFYSLGRQINAFIPSKLRPYLAPVNGDNMWFTTRRNSVNYDPYAAMQYCRDYPMCCTVDKFPVSLPRDLQQQLLYTTEIIRVLLWIRESFNIVSDVSNRLHSKGVEEFVVNEIIKKSSRGLKKRIINREIEKSVRAW